MTDFIGLQLETDSDALAQVAFQYLQDNIPGWTPNDSNLEVILIEALAPLAAEDRDVTSDVSIEVFKYWGNKVVQLPPETATLATTLSTWTMTDNAGYTIHAGDTVGLTNADGELVAFEVQEDVIVPNGVLVTAPGAVTLVAVEEGAAGNDLSGTVEMIDSLDYVADVVVTAPTSGGTDDEDPAVYLSRLADQLRLMAPRPITPADFELMARTFPGIDRARALDMYDPVTDTWDNEKYMTVAAIDANGAALSPGVKAAFIAYITPKLLVNFVFNLIDPQYQSVDVSYTATAYAQYDAADVRTRADAAIASYLSGANWGLPDFGDQRLWIAEQPDLVRFWEIIGLLQRVEGLNTIEDCRIARTGDPLAQADVILPQPVGLPQAGAIVGTVNAP